MRCAHSFTRYTYSSFNNAVVGNKGIDSIFKNTLLKLVHWLHWVSLVYAVGGLGFSKIPQGSPEIDIPMDPRSGESTSMEAEFNSPK